jgi:hypothetical protein
MSSDKARSEAVTIAKRFLESENFTGLVYSHAVYVQSDAPLNTFSDSDVWLVFFESPRAVRDGLEPNALTVIVECASQQPRILPSL